MADATSSFQLFTEFLRMDLEKELAYLLLNYFGRQKEITK